jgi:hypothetical protein
MRQLFLSKVIDAALQTIGTKINDISTAIDAMFLENPGSSHSVVGGGLIGAGFAVAYITYGLVERVYLRVPTKCHLHIGKDDDDDEKVYDTGLVKLPGAIIFVRSFVWYIAGSVTSGVHIACGCNLIGHAIISVLKTLSDA